jgi:hypothetical protein
MKDKGIEYCGKGIYQQINNKSEKNVPSEYKNLSLETIEKVLLQMTTGRVESKDKRKFKMGTGKMGYIQYLNAWYKDLKTEEELVELNKKWQEELPQGMYMITEEGVEYYGQGLKKQVDSL